MRRRNPTPVQKLMLWIMTGVFVLLLAFLVPEIAGIISTANEDTLSEVFFDTSLWVTIPVSILFILTGVAFVWAGGHFIEGWIRRSDMQYFEDAENKKRNKDAQ